MIQGEMEKSHWYAYCVYAKGGGRKTITWRTNNKFMINLFKLIPYYINLFGGGGVNPNRRILLLGTNGRKDRRTDGLTDRQCQT